MSQNLTPEDQDRINSFFLERARSIWNESALNESERRERQVQFIVDMSAILKRAAKLGLVKTMGHINTAVQEAGYEMEGRERPVIECTHQKS